MPDRGDLLKAAVARWPDNAALITDQSTLSYRGLDAHVDAAAGHLERLGVQERTRVAILADHSRQYVTLLHALWRIGAVACPVSAHLPREAVIKLLDAIDSSLLLTDDRWLDEPWPPELNLVAMDAVAADRADMVAFERRASDPNRPATIMFTSGSAGAPKAVLHSYDNHYYSALGSNENIVVAPGDRWLLALPLWHVGGLAILFRTMLGGAAAVLDDRGDPLGTLIERHEVTHLSLVSTQLRRLRDRGLSSEAAGRLKAVIVGGSSVPGSLVVASRQRGWPVCTTYGSTEMASQITTSSPLDSDSPPASSGRLLPHRELNLAGDNEILVRGRTLFEGYVLGDEVDPNRDADGWHHSGDLGRLEPDGRLYVTGRKDNMFISGGENIYPEEIEALLCSLPLIDRAIVVPVDDGEFGQRPVAFVGFAGGAEPGRAEILTTLARTLPRFKQPVRMYRWPDTMEPSLKPLRHVFRELATRTELNQLS